MSWEILSGVSAVASRALFHPSNGNSILGASRVEDAVEIHRFARQLNRQVYSLGAF
jgi:hypothetical protein